MIYNTKAKLWLPNNTVKMDRCWRFIQRNTRDLTHGIARTSKKRSVAVQAGAHVGIFPNHLAGFFDTVFTFEPDPDLFECLKLNAKPNVVISPFALSDVTSTVRYRRNVNGTGMVLRDGVYAPEGDEEIDVQAVTLDTIEMPGVNFIHLDVEGYEIDVLRGAALLIEKCSPVLQLEILPRFQKRIYGYIEAIGYQLATDAGRDHVFKRRKGLR